MNESTMVERVARAILDSVNEHDATWETTSQEIQTTFLIMARAAIEAMREPTKKMMEAYASGGISDPNRIILDGFRYDAMIDAALKE